MSKAKIKKSFKPSQAAKEIVAPAPNSQERAAINESRLNEPEASDSPDIQENAIMTALFNEGRFTELEVLFRTWTVRFPKYVPGWQALGAILRQQKRNAETLEPLQKITELLPGDADAHFRLGNTLLELGQPDDAVMSYRRALELKQDYVEAHSNLGNALLELGQLDDAMASYRRVLEIKPDSAEAHSNLGVILLRQGRMVEAESCQRRALAINPDFVEAKKNFAACVKNLSFSRDDNSEVRTAVIQALSDAWGRPCDLARVGANLFKLNKNIGATVAKAAEAWPQRLLPVDLFSPASFNTVAADSLLNVLLISTPNYDIELERFLTMARRFMLDAASKAVAFDCENAIALSFYGALARQCFINEYVFAWADDEAVQARSLRDLLIAALEAGELVPAIWPVAVAAYFPLYSLSNANRLLNKSWPEAVNAVLQQQILEPEQEWQCRTTLVRLTPIENEVSLLVQNQYEENPYPRWIKTALADKPLTINQYFHQHFPLSPFRPLNKDSDPDILIAGCGTGLQSIMAAQSFLGAQVLAVDLSLSSLCYAKRKTRELGITSIEYAQADILKLTEISRRFDIIESVGVLFLLDNPWEGWQVLLSLLRPGGFMRLGFYSEAARRDIVQARSFIAEQGYGSTKEDIRRCRQDIMDLDDSMGFSSVMKAPDFFSISDCRDHLFNVHEYHMTLTDIEVFLRNNNLQFLGFDISAHIIQAYRLRFPDNPSATNLTHWHIFENDNPNTFREMYQFWVQKTN